MKFGKGDIFNLHFLKTTAGMLCEFIIIPKRIPSSFNQYDRCDLSVHVKLDK